MNLFCKRKMYELYVSLQLPDVFFLAIITEYLGQRSKYNCNSSSSNSRHYSCIVIYEKFIIKL